jgi:cytoskeletal protein CcmA (bactofilin family)
MLILKRRIVKLAVAALVILSFALPAGAVEKITGDTVVVPAGKITGPLFTAGNYVVVDADVDGDVFVAGQDITINGDIKGDLLAAARTVRINGKISGNVRCAVSDLDLNSEIGKSLTVAAAQVRLHEESEVGDDATVFAGTASFSGTVGRQALGAGGDFRIYGPVGGNVHFWEVESLTVGQAASIKGNLTYGSPKEADILPGAKITGQTKWEQIQRTEQKVRHEGINWIAQLIWFISGVLVWGVLVLILPGIWGGLSKNILQSPGSALGWGFLALLAAPLAFLLLLITVIGIPLSLTLIMVYMLLLYAAKIIVGDAIGRFLSVRFGWEGKVHGIWLFMIGFAALILLGKIPVVGFFISLAAAATAIGAVILAVRRWRNSVAAH